MTLSSRHRIRNSSPGGLRPSTLPLGHGGSPQYWLSHVDGEETFFVSFKSPRLGTEPRTLAWKAAVLTATLGPPPRPTSRPVFVGNPVYIRMHCLFFRWDLIQPQNLPFNLIIWLIWTKLRCRTMTALHVLMFQMKLMMVYCSYSNSYIILLEAGTEIHASYVNNLYDPRWIKNGTTIIYTLMQDCI